MRDAGCGFIAPPHTHSREDGYSIVLEGGIGCRSDDAETVLGPGGCILKPRGETHAMSNAGPTPGRIIEIIGPGGFEHNFGDRGAFAELAEKYGLIYGHPDWLGDVVDRYNLTPPLGRPVRRPAWRA
ncbi:cupin domain-containing protein [Streptomyces sp. PSRA5]|uniref:cupin domain-containing protein n=1 Tax=Streptomyces panacea TaxID=3035064 RepID=UPI00339C1298